MCKPAPNLLVEAQAANNGLKHFCFDLETGYASEEDIQSKIAEWKPASNVKDPEKIAAGKIAAYNKAREKSALLDRAPITVIAVATDAGNMVLTCIPDPCPVKTMPNLDGEIRYFKTEKEMLVNLREWVAQRTSPVTEIIGFNSRNFDLPKLRNAYIRHKLQLPELFIPNRNSHYDVMREYLRGYTTEFADDFYIKLKVIQSRFGLPEYKDIISGADAPRLAAEGRSKLVIPYCYMDTMTTYLAYKFMTGQLQDVQ